MFGDNSGKEGNVILRAYKGTVLNASKLIKTGDGVLGKLVIGSCTSGTFRIYDGTTLGAGVAIGGTYTPTSLASSIVALEPLGFDTGLFISVSGGLDATVYYF